MVGTIARGIVAALITTLIAVTADAAEPLEDAIRRLAAQIAANPGLKSKRVGVVDFSSDGGLRTSVLGTNVAERLEAALSRLARQHDFEVVDRRGLENVRKEWSLWMTDLVNASEAKHLGNLAGLNVLVLGGIVEYADHMQLTVRPVEAATGKNLGAEEAAIRKDATVKELFAKTVAALSRPTQGGRPPEARIEQLESTSTSAPPPAPPGMKVELWTDRPLYALGDSIRFHFRTNRDAYITLINVSANGSMSMIFPNSYTKNNFVKGGETTSVPSDSDKYGFVVHGTPGTELVRILATEMPFDWGLHNLPAAPGPFTTFTKKEVVLRASSEISSQKTKVEPSKLADAILKFEVR